MAGVPIPSLTGGASGPAIGGASGGAYGANSAGGAWIVNLKGSQDATGAASSVPSWVLWAGVAVGGFVLWRYFKSK